MFKTAIAASAVAVTLAAPVSVKENSEVWTAKQEAKNGIKTNLVSHKLSSVSLPSEFTWCDKNGTNYCTMSRNQHIPQYCGSCWAHGAISALGDRVKIARKAKGIDINLSVQHMLNCGDAGSCYGGSVAGPYQWIKDISDATGTGISYETSNPYMACSDDSSAGFCGHADWSCSAENVAKTCSTFPENGGKCVGLTKYPNVTVASYGTVSGPADMAQEIFKNGPISCGIDAAPILSYPGGVVSMPGSGVDHVISVVGWGKESGKEYWIVRNSWGEYWGESGYIRVEKGNNALHLEEECAFATVGHYTEVNFPCNEGGENCM